MKQSLLDIVQDILNDLDGDEVNSIDDTFESQQVAAIVRSVYFEMISGRNWPHTREAIQVDSSGNPAYPTHMKAQSNIKEMVFLNYNKVKQGETRLKYEPVRYIEPDDFLRVCNQRNNNSDTVDVITDYTGVQLLIVNNKAPEYYTSFDDENLVFDSYDKSVDTTLQKSKVQAMAYVIPTWTHTDDFIPDLPMEAFPALVEESKSTASFKLRQVTDSKAEQKAVRQKIHMSRKAWVVDGGIKYPNFGRR